jgi:CDGSH-type Zn-finger protein
LDKTRENPGEEPIATEPTTIKTLVDGPLRVEGTFTVVNAEGEVISQKSKVSLCRCGASKNKPFCDGTHREIGFSSEGK